MNYCPQKKYFKKDELAFLRQTLPIVIPFVGQSCTYYTLGRPGDGKTKPFPRHPAYNIFGYISGRGKLPDSAEDKRNFLYQIVEYLVDGMTSELFLLWLDPKPIPLFRRQNRVYKFDHHDDTACWALNLSDEENIALNEAFTRAGLPTDLFAPQ
jgi:hypothetical protein